MTKLFLYMCRTAVAEAMHLFDVDMLASDHKQMLPLRFAVCGILSNGLHRSELHSSRKAIPYKQSADACVHEFAIAAPLLDVAAATPCSAIAALM